ncbi:MAG: hypothetical protein ACLUSP_00915 [Christensenellales bacterium]
MSCLAATAKRGDTRLICVVVGAPDSKTRNAQVCGLFNYGFPDSRARNSFVPAIKSTDRRRLTAEKSGKSKVLPRTI